MLSGMADPGVFRTRLRVRIYELDVNGHVNNAVYLNYAEQAATEHAESLGFGRDWTRVQGGAWVVRRHTIEYRSPAEYGDEIEITTRIVEMRGARGTRRSTLARVSDATLLAEVQTEWAWVRLADGRPVRIPEQVIAAFKVAETEE